MMDSNFWAQINWYAVGTLALQVAFLVAAVWFAKSVLRVVRSFQEQIGALLKLSILPGAERQAEGASAKHSLGETSPYWLTPPERPAGAAPAEPVESGPGLIASAWHALGSASHRVGSWLNEPMSGGLNPFLRVKQWLQSPAGTGSAAH
jgi:hypothetical protein